MKIVVLNGSARKGNTLAAVQAFMDGVQGHEVELINTDGLNVSPCKGCNACGCTKGCVAQDDSNMIVDKLVEADMLVFASPVYWWGVTAQLKTVIDKAYCKGAFMKNKKAGVIIVGAETTDDEEYDIIYRQFKCIAEYLDWDLSFYKAYSAREKNDLAQNEAAMSELKALGASIAE